MSFRNKILRFIDAIQPVSQSSALSNDQSSKQTNVPTIYFHNFALLTILSIVEWTQS